MGSVWVREFRGGLDTRRLPETSAGGTLIRANDCHVTPGGDIEQRADFVEVWTAPLGSCVGLASTPTSLVTFGHVAGSPAGMPANFSYQRLQHPDGEQLVGVPSYAMFGGELATAGLFSDGDRYLFLNATRVTDANAPPQLGGIGPRAVRTLRSKLAAGAGPSIFFSEIRDGDDFTNTGAGFVDMGFEVGTDAQVNAIVEYENYHAIFFRSDIMIWLFVADPTDSSPIQRLASTGTFSAQAAIPWRDGDVLYYDTTGIRSLRARDSSKSAMTVDIGSPIDALTQAAYFAADATTLEFSCAVVDPLTGRAWIAIDDQIFVLSHYPESKITAWSIYRPGFRVDAMAVFNDRVYLRSGQTFYVYGSETGPLVYSDDVQAEAWLPYLDANSPAIEKHLTGFDAACRGTWEVRVGFDPENEDASDLLARIAGSTFWRPRHPGVGSGTHVGMRFKSLAPPSAAVPALLSSIAIHHDLDPETDH